VPGWSHHYSHQASTEPEVEDDEDRGIALRSPENQIVLSRDDVAVFQCLERQVHTLSVLIHIIINNNNNINNNISSISIKEVFKAPEGSW